MPESNKNRGYIIKNALVFDGSCQPPKPMDVLIEDGRVSQISTDIEDKSGDRGLRTIDAEGRWLMPGFIDTHTHYDAELLLAPALKESVRHGVTTVVIGSCSISMVLSEAEDCSDMFTRVESVPREQVLPALQSIKHWNSAADYKTFYDQHPIGPNVASFLGHSDLRTAVLGMAKATDKSYRPNETEMQQMEQLLEDALQKGLLGLSTMTTRWDKIDGDRYRSASLPSTYATWKEFRRLNRILRKYDGVHQGAPNIVTKWNTALFLWESMGLFRKRLKTTLITLMDGKASPGVVGVVSAITRVVNWFKGDFKWQALPTVFEVYADGMDLVVFEEFGAGEAALHLQDQLERNELLKDESYRRRFRKDYDKKWGARVWQRDFYDADIVDCPDASLIGKSFGQLADKKGLHPADLFLDLVVEYGTRLRWHTVIANHRPEVLDKIVRNPDAIISFADSGAHIRNMAFYNFPLRFLKLVKQRIEAGKTDFTMAQAVHKLTGELADWFGLEAGYIKTGARADLCLVDPDALSQNLDDYNEAEMEGFGDLKRMVNRNPGAVSHVWINGRLAMEDETFDPALGQETGFGRFLCAGKA